LAKSTGWWSSGLPEILSLLVSDLGVLQFRKLEMQLVRRLHAPSPSHTFVYLREMENIIRGPTFGDFVTILTEGSMKDNTRLQQDYKVQGYRLPSPPLFSM
jgi:hypothetical protein